MTSKSMMERTRQPAKRFKKDGFGRDSWCSSCLIDENGCRRPLPDRFERTVDPKSGVLSSSAPAPSSISYPEDIGEPFFPFSVLLLDTLGLVGRDEFFGVFPPSFDFVAFG